MHVPDDLDTDDDATMLDKAPASAPADVAGAVDAAAQGSAAGWDWLFERFHLRVYRYAIARVGDDDVAGEVAQEVFVAAVGSIGRLKERSESGVEGWFLRIARNKLADHARRRARERPRIRPDLVSDDPGELATARVDAVRLRRALERLTEEQRDVVVRRFVLDQSLDDVARATRRPVGAVKAMQHRALASLARHLHPGEMA